MKSPPHLAFIVQTFSPCHKSIKDYVNDAEKKIQKINTLHLPKSNNNNDFHFLLGEKVELDKSKKEIIELFVKTRNIQLSEDFFEFGNLRYSITPQIMGGNSINGTSDEKSKYYLLSDTVDILLDCMHWSIIEKALSGLSCIKLLLTNTGTTYDEDVEISLNIPKEYYMFYRLVKQFAQREGVTEQLKAENQMLWVKKMNSIRNRAEEIVNHGLIYS